MNASFGRGEKGMGRHIHCTYLLPGVRGVPCLGSFFFLTKARKPQLE